MMELRGLPDHSNSLTITLRQHILVIIIISQPECLSDTNKLPPNASMCIILDIE